MVVSIYNAGQPIRLQDEVGRRVSTSSLFWPYISLLLVLTVGSGLWVDWRWCNVAILSTFSLSWPCSSILVLFGFILVVEWRWWWWSNRWLLKSCTLDR